MKSHSSAQTYLTVIPVFYNMVPSIYDGPQIPSVKQALPLSERIKIVTSTLAEWERPGVATPDPLEYPTL